MSFGGKNPPWARPVGDGLAVAGLQQQVGMGGPVLSQPGVNPQTVYSIASPQPTIAQHQYATQQVALAGVQNALQQGASILSQPGIALPTTLASSQVATVSYPAPRPPPPGPVPAKQRVFTGTVTKLHDNFGFVDEDVFFQTTSVKGVLPKVNDRVLVEASYNANMPFKWNATRIQVLPHQVMPPCNPVQNQPPQQMGPGLLKPPSVMPSITPSVVPQPPPSLLAQNSHPIGPPHSGRGPSMRGPPMGREQPPNMQGMYDRDRGMRERHREPDRRERRERRISPRKRSRSPRRSRSPSLRTRSPQRTRRPGRVVPRYMVQVPKISLDTKEVNVISLKSRYQNLYIPSDFFNAQFSWVDAFPAHQNFELGHNCNFHVLSKEVVSVEKSDAVLEPSDADHLFSAKVMLMASPPMQEIYHKSCGLAEDTNDQRDSFQHPTRLLQFLVGLKGKSEPMAIGGPWSPSLDGANPADDPRTLIKTAIRTTKALTGIDLSNCTQWYRFAEIRYHRQEELHKNRLVPARVETVVIFLPDVWSCTPSRLEWEALQSAYKKQLQDKIAAENKEESQEDEEDSETSAEKLDPTHYSELDPKLMKVNDLRRELESRVLSSKGLKSQLIARLTKALRTEQEKEEDEKEKKVEEKEEQEEKKENDDRDEERRKRDEEDSKRKEEREKVQRERRYTLPDNTAILVHPNPHAKNGKFDCTVMSLSVLLDYRPEDNKEHSFEVSLFAELFNEMLMRDFAFKIYTSLTSIADKPKDEKKHKEKDKKDEKKDDRDKKEEKDKKEEEKSGEPETKKRKTEERETKKEESKAEKKEENDEDKKETEAESTEMDTQDEEDKEKDKKKDDKKKDHKEREKEKTKYITHDAGLLLAFVYFDQTHTGYLLDKDAEEIMHTMGLHLSRSQVRKQLNKLVSRDILNYRKLTDKAVGEKPAKEEKKKDEEAGVEAKKVDESKEMETDDAENVDSSDLEQVGLGNKHLLPIHGNSKGSPSRKNAKKVPEGLVQFKGALVDIASVMQRSEKSDKLRNQLETKLQELQDEMEEMQTNLNNSEQTGQKVAVELVDLKKKLREQKKQTDSANHSLHKYQDLAVRAKDQLSSLVEDCSTVIREESKDDIKTEVKTEVAENGTN